MKPLILTIILVFISTCGYALDKMTEPEMKEATAQLASVAGEVANVGSPVAQTAGNFGPAVAPVVPVVSFGFWARAQADPGLQAKDTSDSLGPVTRLLQVSGDLSGLTGFF